MIVDPLTTWKGPFPYAELAAAGVTPELTQSDMADVSFTLMTRRMLNPRTQKAWDELRMVRTRLLADVLLYDVDPATDAPDVEREPVSEPPEVARALSPAAAVAGDLADEIKPVRLPPPPTVQDRHEFGEFPSWSVIDGLIQFDF